MLNGFTDLLGQTLTSVTGEVGGDSVIFKLDNGEKYVLNHVQDCCEDVRIKDISGDLLDLMGSPITKAEEVLNTHNPEKTESSTWTFYHLATIKGYVTIWWVGTSNGYYSEEVRFSEFIL